MRYIYKYIFVIANNIKNESPLQTNPIFKYFHAQTSIS